MALNAEHRSKIAARLSPGSTFGISALVSSLSWPDTLTISSQLGLNHVSFVFFVVDDIYSGTISDRSSKSRTRDDSPFPWSMVYALYDREDRFEIAGSSNILWIRLGISSGYGEWMSV